MDLHTPSCKRDSTRVWECENDSETEKERKKKWIIKSRARDWKSDKHNPITWRMTSNFMITICSSHISVIREHGPLPNGVYNSIEWLIANIQTKSCVCVLPAFLSLSLCLCLLRFLSNSHFVSILSFLDTVARMCAYVCLFCSCSLRLFLRWRRWQWRRRRRWTSFWLIKTE